MMISPEYLAVLVVLLLSVLLKNKKLSYLAIVMMACLAICRAKTVGTDTSHYEDDFYLIHNIDSYEKQIRHVFEPGYAYLIILYKRFYSDYMGFISLTWVIFFIGIIFTMRNVKYNKELAWFIFFTLGFYFYSMNAMRQMMACSLILAFIPFLLKEKYVIFGFVTITVSLLIHRSELMYLLLIPLHYYTTKHLKSINKSFLYGLIIASFLVYYIGNVYLKDSLMLLTLLFEKGDYYAGYIIGEHEGAGNSFSIVYSSFALFLVYLKNKETYKFETYTYVFSIALYNIFNTFSIYGYRVYMDYNLFALFLIPLMIKEKETKYKTYFLIISIIFCLGNFAYRYVFANSGEMNPYIFRF